MMVISNANIRKPAFLMRLLVLCLIFSPALTCMQPAYLSAQVVRNAVSWDTVHTTNPQLVRAQAIAGSALKTATAEFNTRLQLPAAVKLIGKECAKINASYSPQKREIIVCYELIDAIYEDDVKLARDSYNRINTVDATRFFLAHELGHALIDLLALPVLGKKEDAADQFAAFFYLQAKDAMPLMTGVQLLLSLGKTESHSLEKMGDLHALAKQRALNIECWLYANSPQTDAWRAGILPSDRSSQCAIELHQMMSTWSRLLGDRVLPIK